MKYYVYKITNKLNGKWYIGKRKHKSPYDDSYMGSGKLIKEAIKKYGVNSFIKEILDIFDNNDDAAKFEASLVTKQTISTAMSYNMHEGGHGGFAHLNDGSKKHKERCKKASKKSNGRNHPNWGKNKFKKGDKRTIEISKTANEIKKEDIKNNPEKYKKIYSLLSEKQKNNNSMKNRCWCVPVETKDYNKDKKVYLKTEIPKGWITIKQFREKLKRKSGSYGKFWIFNPLTKENKYCKGNIPEGWFKGRKKIIINNNVG